MANKHQILISVGSNVNKTENTQAGLDALQSAFGTLTLSKIYESESVGFKGNNFFNLVVLAFTKLSIKEVCKVLKQIEDQHGRIRDKKFADRTLDLDLLTYDNVVCEAPVVLPREEIQYNAFVLKPTAELVPHHIHPTTQKTYKTLWKEFLSNNPNKHQKLWRADLQWSANKNDIV